MNSQKPRITKTIALKWAGDSPTELAARLGVTPSAVSQWDDELPEGRVWQLVVLGCPTAPERATADAGGGQ